MAKRITRELDTVTAGKFVEIGRKSVDLRERLRRMSQVVSDNSINSSIAGIGQMAGDNVITPEEKKILAEEWEHIVAAYNSTVSTIIQLGVNPDEYQALQTAFNGLKSLMDSILADMDTATTVGDRLNVALEAYESAAKILQNWINSYMNDVTSGISSYRLEVISTPASPTLDDTITFSAKIYIDSIDKTEELKNAHRNEAGLYPDLFIWSVEGTNDDDSLMEDIRGKEFFSIDASDIPGDSVRVYFSSSLNIG